MRAWLYRDIIMGLGVVEATRDGIKYVLTQKGAGHSIVLVVGGTAEIIDCRPDSYVLVLQRRKGFIKLALETGLVGSLTPFTRVGQCLSIIILVTRQRG